MNGLGGGEQVWPWITAEVDGGFDHMELDFGCLLGLGGCGLETGKGLPEKRQPERGRGSFCCER